MNAYKFSVGTQGKTNWGDLEIEGRIIWVADKRHREEVN
jgi:hypothetical protein